MSEYNKKISTTPKTYDTSQDNRNRTPTAPQLQNFYSNHPLSLVTRYYRNTAMTDLISPIHSYPQNPVSHIVVHQPNIEDI